jgi:hypothetical protein
MCRKGDEKMYSTETLPNWFWLVYYLSLLLTIGTGIFSIILKKNVWMSIIAVVVTASIPIVGFVNGMEREEGQNELDQLILNLQQGSIWAIYIVLGYIFLLVWWFFFFSNKKKSLK